MSPADMTDEQLATRLDEIDAERAAIIGEQTRRRTLTDLPGRIDDLTTALAHAQGRTDGGEWVPTEGGHSYTPVGWVVTHRGRRWRALHPTHVEPGDPALDPAIVAQVWEDLGPIDGEEPEPDVPAWVRPTGAHDAYQAGDRVTFEGQVYESVIDGNTWSPAEHPAGWQLIPA